MTRIRWRNEKQMANADGGAPMCLRHVQPLLTVVGYGPAVVGGTASFIGDANGWPTGLTGDPAG